MSAAISPLAARPPSPLSGFGIAPSPLGESMFGGGCSLTGSWVADVAIGAALGSFAATKPGTSMTHAAAGAASALVLGARGIAAFAAVEVILAQIELGRRK